MSEASDSDDVMEPILGFVAECTIVNVGMDDNFFFRYANHQGESTKQNQVFENRWKNVQSKIFFVMTTSMMM